MTQEEAIKVLVMVANMAQKSGILSLQDAVVVSTAVEMFKEKEEVKKEVTPKKKKE